MDLKQIAGTVSKFAPLLGTALGGPVGTIAGGAVKMIADALGCDATAGGISQAIANDPEAYIKLKELEDREKARLHEWNVEQLRAQLADVQSARAMQIAALQQDDIFSKRFIYYFAIAWSLFACAFAIAAFWVHIPPENMRLVDTINGILWGALVSTMFGFFFGNSIRSVAKQYQPEQQSIERKYEQIDSRAPADRDALLERMRTGQ